MPIKWSAIQFDMAT